MVSDSGLVSAGNIPGGTATSDVSSRKATMWTVVLQADPDVSPNVAPEASFTVSCPQATCSFDASDSSDTPPGDIASYMWEFGDGTTGTGETTTHTYTSAGPRTVTLTVTDDEGLTSAPVTRTADPTLPPPTGGDEISFRTATEAAWNQGTARVTIPATVRETDGMVLFVTANKDVNITTPPAGWTLEGTRLSNVDTKTWLYSRSAAANDPGRNAAVTFSATTKSTLTFLAYDGTAADPTADVASAAETVFRATHSTPTADVATAGSYVVSYWADESASTTNGWSLPAGQTQRSIQAGAGTGRISAVASDLGGAAPLGQTTPRAATSAASTAKATMWTVVLQNDQASEPNVAPEASFTVSCPTPACTVDASASTDTAPGTIASYAWGFGDGGTGTGVTTTHTYASSGQKTITLTVTDDQGLTDTATRSIDVTVGGGGGGDQPVPGHTRLVPDRPRTNTPRILNGEISDMEVVGTGNAARVFIAGSFTQLQNTTGANTQTINQPGLASYNLQTGLVDATFRPTFNGSVQAVEASPDGTKLFVGGSFNTVNGVAKQKVASLNLTTGAPLTTFGFTNNTNNQVQSLAATNSTLYVGGRYSRINGQLRTGLAAVDAASGAVDLTFDNSLSGGVGVNGQLGVPQLKLTHDNTKLLVVHTGRQIAGQDRLGMGIIDTSTKQLLPWRSRLWDLNLGRVGGVTRICCADIAPDDSFFVVSSGSGGDAPPISDTAIRFDLDDASLQNDDVQPVWNSRHFDSIYSVAITEQAVYVGGHFQFVEAPGSCTSEPCYPGLENVGYGTGQGLAGYGLGDAVVRRDHLAALSAGSGRALEWYSASNSFEGDKAMEATPRGLLIGGDGMFKGGVRTGRVAFYDFGTETFPAPAPDTTITTPIEGRVVANNQPFEITGTARVSSGTVGRVQVQIQDRDSGQWLQDNGTAFTSTFSNTTNSLNATMASGVSTTRELVDPGHHRHQPEPAGLRPGVHGRNRWIRRLHQSGEVVRVVQHRGPDPDDEHQRAQWCADLDDVHRDRHRERRRGCQLAELWFRDEQQRYLQADGSVEDIFHTFRGEPDVIGATNATWSYEVTLPHEGVWRGSATATDTTGQADLRSATRDWTVDSTASAPAVTIAQPVEMTPPFSAPTVTVEPGSRVTFSGTAADDEGLKNVEISLRNSSTGQALANDCTWGTGSSGTCRISPVDISGSVYNWSWTTPFDLTPGSQLHRPGHRRRGPDHVVEQPGAPEPQRAAPWRRAAEHDHGIHRADRRVAHGQPGRHRGRRDRSRQRAGDAAGPGHRSLSAGQRLPVVHRRLPGGDPRLPRCRRHELVAASDHPAGWGRLAVLRGRLGHPRPAGRQRCIRRLQDLPGRRDAGPVRDPRAAADRGHVRRRQDRRHGPGRGRSGPVRRHRRGRGGRGQRGGPIHGSSGTFTSTSASYRTAFLEQSWQRGSNYSYTTPVIPAGTYSVRYGRSTCTTRSARSGSPPTSW